MTLFHAVLDAGAPARHDANAGHNHPLLFSSSQPRPQPLQTGGITLGLLPDCSFKEASIALQPGDLLVIYSDGITAAQNAFAEEFGEQRLLAVVNQHVDAALPELIDTLLQKVAAFTGPTPQQDDMTWAAVRRVSRSTSPVSSSHPSDLILVLPGAMPAPGISAWNGGFS